jgi:hypothetical protein
MEYQLVLLHIHQRNAAERNIQTFKNHFVAGLCSTHPDLPLRLWDGLLPQAEIMLNLLRTSRSKPHLSIYKALFGKFDYNKNPLMPPGTKVVIHEKPNQCSSWDPHGKLGWYLGPALEHYQCHQCHVSATNSERISDTVEFFPHTKAVEALTSQDAAILTAEALTKALKQRKPPENLAALIDPAKYALAQLH